MAAQTQTVIEAPSHATQRVPELDGIRGLAILPVLAVHCGLTMCPPGLVHDVLGFGWVGVDLFFVLSGFLITGILLDSKGTPDYFKRFYLRRVFRIFPIYYAFVILFFHLAPLIARATGVLASFQYGQSDEVWFWAYLSNWRDAVHQSRYLRHFWSLSIEEQFYLVWPLVLFFASRRTLKYVCAALVVLSPVLRAIAAHQGASPYTLYRATPFRLEGLALGALIALAVRDQSVYSRIKRAVTFLVPSAFAVLLGVILRAGPDYRTVPMATFGYTSIAIICWALVFKGIEQSGSGTQFARFLRQAWLVRFGKYSYGLYVWHLLVAEQIRTTADHIQHRFGSPWILVFLSLLSGIGVSYLIALLSWKLIEEPCARLKERLTSASGNFSVDEKFVKRQGRLQYGHE